LVRPAELLASTFKSDGEEQYFLTRNRPRGILIERLIPPIRFTKPESRDLIFREGFEALEDPLSQPSPVFRRELEDLTF
jgi:hypothetical protein